MSNKIDPRIQRTRKMILEALLELLKKKSFEEITINDLTEKAGIHRTTFYLHYQDKYDLLTQSSKEMMSQLMLEVTLSGNLLEYIMQKTTPPQLLHWFEVIAEQPNLYREMLGYRGNMQLTHELRQHIENLTISWLDKHFEKEDNKSIQIEIISRYVSSAYLGVVEWWLKNNPTIPAKQIANSFWLITSNALAAFVTKTS